MRLQKNSIYKCFVMTFIHGLASTHTSIQPYYRNLSVFLKLNMPSKNPRITNKKGLTMMLKKLKMPINALNLAPALAFLITWIVNKTPTINIKTANIIRTLSIAMASLGYNLSSISFRISQVKPKRPTVKGVNPIFVMSLILGDSHFRAFKISFVNKT